MIVDDEPDLCKTVQLVLEGKGFNVVSAPSGPDALEKLRKEPVDLVLIDYFMPNANGLWLCEMIRKDPKLKDLKLAFLTVATFGVAAKEALSRHNVLDYIQKPFDNKDLIQRVRQMVKE